MRLRLSVQRNGLPTTNILWSVPDTNSPQAYTITRLLEDINQVLPLEAEQWGLEDYIVEIGGFECLHFSPVSQALRDDDHVSIRPLLTAEVRSRTLCGRHQISEDGRHLLDGIPFGRPYLRQPSRPAVRIPPRKRRRLEELTEAGAEETEIAGLITNGETSPLLVGNGPTSSATTRPQDKQTRVGKGDRAVRFAQAEADDLDDSDDLDEEFVPSGESDSDVSMNSDSDSDSSSSASDPSDSSELSSLERDSESSSDSDSSSTGSDSENLSSEPDVVSSKTPPKPLVPPGNGHKNTKLRNRRRVQSEQLRRLKSAGKLDQNATLKDMRTYIENSEVRDGWPTPAKTMSAPTGKRKRLAEQSTADTFPDESMELERRKQEFMANLDMGTPQSETLKITTPTHSPQVQSPKASSSKALSEKTSSIGEAGETPPRKRLRPDTSAIGRMLARQTKNIQKKSPRTKRSIEQTPEPEGASDPDFWKSRIKLSAFECWDEEFELSAPPFPFKQHWDPGCKRMREKVNKKKNKKSKKRGSASPEVEENTETLILDYDDSPYATKQDSDPTAAIESQLMQDAQVAAQSDLPSLPEDVEALPALEPKDIQVGTVVVFKMWIINPETVTPEFSEYRTAVVEKEGDSGNGAGSFRLRLAARDIPKEQKVDENVQNAKDGFHIDVNESDEKDKGIWEGTFTELISPKLLKAVA